MPQKIQVTGSPAPLGFSVSVSNVEMFKNSLATDVISSLLEVYASISLCHFQKDLLDGEAWPKGGTKFTVWTPTKQIAVNLCKAVQLLDNKTF